MRPGGKEKQDEGPCGCLGRREQGGALWGWGPGGCDRTEVGPLETVSKAPYWDEVLANNLPISFVKKGKGNNPQQLHHEN